MGRGTWRATVHGVAESDRTERLSTAQHIHKCGFPGGSVKKNLPTNGFSPWVGKIPWRRKRQPTAVFLPGESHGQRSLAGYSPWSHRVSDMTEHRGSVCYQTFFTWISHRYLKPLPMSSVKFIHQHLPFSMNTITDYAFIQAQNLGSILSSFLMVTSKHQFLSILSPNYLPNLCTHFQASMIPTFTSHHLPMGLESI